MKILFMCVANSARSQIAEGLARSLFGDEIEFYSAGSKPSRVNPIGIKVMREIGIDISQYSSKSVEDVPVQDFDYVITLCAEEVCPVYLGKTSKRHWPFPDPAGESNPILAEKAFRKVRDLIKEKLQTEIPYILSK